MARATACRAKGFGARFRLPANSSSTSVHRRWCCSTKCCRRHSSCGYQPKQAAGLGCESRREVPPARHPVGQQLADLCLCRNCDQVFATCQGHAIQSLVNVFQGLCSATSRSLARAWTASARSGLRRFSVRSTAGATPAGPPNTGGCRPADQLRPDSDPGDVPAPDCSCPIPRGHRSTAPPPVAPTDPGFLASWRPGDPAQAPSRS